MISELSLGSFCDKNILMNCEVIELELQFSVTGITFGSIVEIIEHLLKLRSDKWSSTVYLLVVLKFNEGMVVNL